MWSYFFKEEKMPNEKTFSLETQQELLDELMGPNRNEDKHDSVVDVRDEMPFLASGGGVYRCMYEWCVVGKCRTLPTLVYASSIYKVYALIQCSKTPSQILEIAHIKYAMTLKQNSWNASTYSDNSMPQYSLSTNNSACLVVHLDTTGTKRPPSMNLLVTNHCLWRNWINWCVALIRKLRYVAKMLRVTAISSHSTSSLGQWMQNGKRRLEDTGEGTAQQMDLENRPEMMELTTKIEEKVQQSEKAGKLNRPVLLCQLIGLLLNEKSTIRGVQEKKVTWMRVCSSWMKQKSWRSRRLRHRLVELLPCTTTLTDPFSCVSL